MTNNAAPSTSDRRDVVAAVLIVNYFTSKSVKDLIESILEHADGLSVVISVVDNSCDSAEYDRIQSLAVEFRCRVRRFSIVQANNLGYAGGNNLAWDEVSDQPVDVVIVVNPDVRLISGSLRSLVESAQAARIPTLFSVRTLTDGQEYTGQAAVSRLTGHSRQLRCGELPRRYEEFYPGGHFLLMNREIWEAVSGFNESYFLYCEEIDLSLRVGQMLGSLAVVTSQDVEVAHEGALSFQLSKPIAETASKSTLTFRHGTRSRIILFHSHGQLRSGLLFVVFTRIIWALTLLVRGNQLAAQQIYLGLWDGLRWRPAPTRAEEPGCES